MSTPSYPERRRPSDTVREIGSTTFRDRPEPEPVKSEPPVSEAVRRFRESAANGIGLSSAAARVRGGLS